MKLCFSTLGCPDWSFSEIITTAKDLGFAGIEIRGILHDVYAPDMKIFKEEHLKQTKAELQKLNLKVSCLSSDCMVGTKDDLAMQQAKEYIDLAANLQAVAVRVMGDANALPSQNISDEILIENLKALCQYAQEKNVMVYVETNGAYADSAHLLKVLRAVSYKNLGVIWDILHPIRNYQEAVETTYHNLKDYIRHIHIKDCVISDNSVQYKMLGSGALPIKEVISLLKKDNFDGFVSFEWLKRWNKDLEDAGIVFCHFISTMQGYINEK